MYLPDIGVLLAFYYFFWDDFLCIFISQISHLQMNDYAEKAPNYELSNE